VGEFVLFLEEQFLDPVSFVQVFSLSPSLSPDTASVALLGMSTQDHISILKLLFFRFQNPGLAPLSLSLATNVKLLKSFLIVH
jgi:hypothetical protein